MDEVSNDQHQGWKNMLLKDRTGLRRHPFDRHIIRR